FADAVRAATPAAVTPASARAPLGHSDPTLIEAPDATIANVPSSVKSETTRPPTTVAAPPQAARSPVLAIVVAVVAVAVGLGAWFVYQRQTADTTTTAQAPTTGMIRASAPPPADAAVRMTTAAPKPEPGTLTISAVGLIDPSDPRYQSDKALRQTDLRADSKSQVVEKAVALLLDTKSLAKNYDLLNDRLLSKSASFIKTVVRESEPRMGKDGLMSITTEAVVNVRALQKSLNQMSRDERIDFIRASGDPKVSVQIAVRDA